MRIHLIDAHKQGTFWQNQDTFFCKSEHFFSIFKKGPGKFHPLPSTSWLPGFILLDDASFDSLL